jgi:hypothetical protein
VQQPGDMLSATLTVDGIRSETSARLAVKLAPGANGTVSSRATSSWGARTSIGQSRLTL